MLRQGGATREGMAGGLYLRRYLGAGLLLQAAVLYTLKVCLTVATGALQGPSWVVCGGAK